MAVLKIIEVVGLSLESWEAAARSAVAEAARTVRGIESVEIVRATASVRDGAILEYQALVRLQFRVEAGSELLQAVEEAETILAEPTSATPIEAIGLPLAVEVPELPPELR